MLPPSAKKVKAIFSYHGQELVDNYSWLREASWPNLSMNNIAEDIKEYIEKENKYFDVQSEAWRSLKDEMISEMKSWLPREDVTVPVKKGDYIYYKRINAAEDYYSHWRRKYADGSDFSAKANETDELLLDENKLAEDKPYFRLGDISVSDCGSMLLYSYDETGEERYAVVIKEISSEKVIDSFVSDAMSSVLWRSDGAGFFYFPAGKEWRSNRLNFHYIGKDKVEDETIYFEEDDTYSLNLTRSCSEEYIFLSSSSSDSNYIMVSRSNEADFKTVIAKEEKLLYDIEHKGDKFLLLINDKGPQNRLISFNLEDIGQIQDGYKEKCKELIQTEEGRFISNMLVFEKAIVLTFMINGLNRIIAYDDSNDMSIIADISFPEQSYYAEAIFTHFTSQSLRFLYSSLSSPYKIIEKDLVSGEERILKSSFRPEGFNEEDYIVERIYATSSDKTSVPISLVRKVGCERPCPAFLYGYGSYEISVEPHFRSSVISLLDRGFCFAIAHIRGGGDMGRSWYEAAKMLTKKKTFEDFEACARHLISEGYTSSNKLAIHGGSAGGMLIGACINMSPDLYKVAIADVPFVDVLNTMLDASLPLTPGEYKEWGNPLADSEYFNYILSYSPYENVKEGVKYPNIFATTGLNDPRVGYWEAAKWVAQLRNSTAGDNIIVMKTNMEAGHGGNSGRSKRIEELAEHYAFAVHNCT